MCVFSSVYFQQASQPFYSTSHFICRINISLRRKFTDSKIIIWTYFVRHEAWSLFEMSKILWNREKLDPFCWSSGSNIRHHFMDIVVVERVDLVRYMPREDEEIHNFKQLSDDRDDGDDYEACAYVLLLLHGARRYKFYCLRHIFCL